MLHSLSLHAMCDLLLIHQTVHHKAICFTFHIIVHLWAILSHLVNKEAMNKVEKMT